MHVRMYRLQGEVEVTDMPQGDEALGLLLGLDFKLPTISFPTVYKSGSDVFRL